MKQKIQPATTDILGRLKPYDEKKDCVNAIIETPKGSAIKYAYDFETGLFEVRKVLPAGMIFPFNFGFLPQTKAEDGDPLDILLLNEEPMVCGCLAKVRVVAVMRAEQAEGKKWVRNDRLIGEALGKEFPTTMENVRLDERTVSRITYFFTTYNQWFGKQFKVLGVAGPEKAWEIVRKVEQQHQSKRRAR